jgi:hypothetical protein
MLTAIQVQLTQRLRDGREVEQIRFKTLDEGFHETPLPGDWIRVSGREVTTELTGLSEDGSVSEVTRTTGSIGAIRLAVVRRIWQLAGVLLICEPPEDYIYDAGEVLRALEGVGFEPLKD